MSSSDETKSGNMRAPPMDTNSEVPSGLDALKKARIERSLKELEDLIEEVDLSEEGYQEDSDSSLIFD
ncbi:unnamed protein product [Caenorhabditis nigoni]